MIRKVNILVLVILLSFTTIAFSEIKAEGERTSQVVVDPVLMEKLAGLTGAVEVIVTFHGEGAPTSQNLETLRSAGITNGLSMESLPIVGILATAEQVEMLANSSQIRSLYYNAKLEYDNADATALTGVNKVRKDKEFTRSNNGLPVSGKGVTVLVNDSGVDGTHKDIKFGSHLIQNVMASTNLHAIDELLPITYVEDVPNTDTNSGHGTHVAGTVAGTGEMSNGKHEGVAPGANLVGYGSGAGIAILDTIGAFDYAVTHQIEYGIRVITNSWGATSDSGTAFDPSHPINVATKKCYDRGIVVVFSAGNSGPGESTISGNYKKAPWVITVAAGDKQGKLASFSSRGEMNRGGAFQLDGKVWSWEDRPTVTSPGVDIISTRVISPIPALAATKDAEYIETAYLPYYTTMSGTSMAAPHLAGIVALLLEVDPSLSPDEVKMILQKTATNIPGNESWEVGAGYVNAYAAVDMALNQKEYGQILNINRTFHSDVAVNVTKSPFTVSYNPLSSGYSQFPIDVADGVSELSASVNASGLEGLTGNPVNLVLISPDGTEYTSGVSALFPLYPNRSVTVPTPVKGEWNLNIRGLFNVVGLPEEVRGKVTQKVTSEYHGLDDIKGHPAEEVIKIAVSERLVDGFSDKNFKPNQNLSRIQLAKNLVMGTGTRQSLSIAPIYTDVKAEDRAFAEAVASQGAALRDSSYTQNGVLLSNGVDTFSPNQSVSRAELAYSLVQALGLQNDVEQIDTTTVTVQYKDQRVSVEDASEIPEQLRGYVQYALDLNILNAYFTVTQGPYDVEPTIHAHFYPSDKVTRGDYAVAITRFYNAFLVE
jgi:serine protease AprX